MFSQFRHINIKTLITRLFSLFDNAFKLSPGIPYTNDFVIKIMIKQKITAKNKNN